MRHELLDEIVTAAQEVVNNEEIGHFSPGGNLAAVDRDDLDRLRRVVKAISDEAYAEIVRDATDRAHVDVARG